MKSSDIPSLLNRGYADVGFIGSDKIDEQKLGGMWRNLGEIAIADTNCDLVAASNVVSPYVGKEIVTSFPNLTQRWLDGQNSPSSVIGFSPSGSVEAFIALGLADTIVDIRETGNSLLANGLVEVAKVEPVVAKMLWREGKEVAELDANNVCKALSTIADRKNMDADTVTARLLRNTNELVKKIGSESAEFVQDLVLKNESSLVMEGQDVVYSIAVALTSLDRSLIECLNLL